MSVLAVQAGEFRARLSGETDLAGWRDLARRALAADIAPESLEWEVKGRAAALDLIPRQNVPAGNAPFPLRLHRSHLSVLMTGLLHNDPDRFALAYRLLWRMRDTPGLMGNPADRDVRRIAAMAKNVRRDIHKMHAFVRFRKVGERTDDTGEMREQFAAWFEPEHHITAHVARFFRDRFTGMDWIIVTPRASIAWDGAQLHLGPSGKKSDVPDSDAVEEEWRSYYRSIFNPARVKVQAMKSEMPAKYWKNLPEAELISGLINESARRVQRMQDMAGMDVSSVATSPAPQLSGHALQQPFADLDTLNHSMMTRNDWPWEGFSQRFIIGEGPDDAAIMLVGEQPGDQEDRQQRVFTGPAGQLLDKALADASIARDQCYLTNAVKRFKYEPRGERRIHRTPSASDIGAYRDWLLLERQIIRPKVTIALGASAARALMARPVKVSHMRGLHRSWDDIGDLVITTHPAFLLRLQERSAYDVEYGHFVRDLMIATE